MPLIHEIDASRRLIVARGVGSVTDEDVFAFARMVAADRELAGYDTLLDMTGPVEIVAPQPHRVRELATLAAAADPPGTAARLAIVAPEGIALGLANMYAVRRGSEPGGRKEVRVFRTVQEARAYLDL